MKPGSQRILLALLLISVLLFSACSAPASQKAAAETFTRTLAVGYDSEFPPFTFYDSQGLATGFDYELAQEVCRRLGWLFVPVPMNWGDKDELLDSGAIDCIWSCFSITGRESQYAWTAPYLDNRFVILARKNLAIGSLADLADKRVCVQSASSESSMLTTRNLTLENSFASLLLADDVTSAVMFLRGGEVDACVLDLGTAEYYCAQWPDELRVVDDALSDDRCGVAFRPGDEKTADAVENELAAMAADGSLQALADKWQLGDLVCAGLAS